jgi:putative aldouronate transport system permease protein
MVIKASKLTESKNDNIFYIISGFFLALLIIITAYPLYFVAIASISNINSVNRGDVLLIPKGIQFDSYIRIFQNRMVLIGYRNTVLYSVLGTIIRLFMTMTAGYALSVKFPGRKTIMFMITFTMFFGGGLIPNYFLRKNLGMLDTIWVLIIPGAVVTYQLIIARTFLQTNIPPELYEAAEMDGCTRIRFFLYIVIPLSKVLLAILTLYSVVAYWNSYFDAMIYLNRRSLYTLQLVLREILIQNTIPIDQDTTTDPEIFEQMRQVKELMKYALIIVSCLPMLIMYPFIQKHFVKGVMIGSLKG